MNIEPSENIQRLAEKSLKSFHEIKRLSINEIYEKALLTENEKQMLMRYSEIIDERLIYYYGYWLCESPSLNKNNIIKYIASILLKLTPDVLIGEVESVVKHLFNESMSFQASVRDNSYGVKPKSMNFYDSLFELKIMEFFINKNFKIDITKTKLSSGKVAEYYIFNEIFGFYAEAKNLDVNVINNIIYDDSLEIDENYSPRGVFSLGEEEQREIRERFKKQFALAKRKFVGVNENYGIFLNMPHPLGIYGEKLQIYLNKVIDSDLPQNLVYLGFFFTNKIFLYDHQKRKIEVIKTT